MTANLTANQNDEPERRTKRRTGTASGKRRTETTNEKTANRNCERYRVALALIGCRTALPPLSPFRFALSNT